jgi:hypothetical protein
LAEGTPPVNDPTLAVPVWFTATDPHPSLPGGTGDEGTGAKDVRVLWRTRSVPNSSVVGYLRANPCRTQKGCCQPLELQRRYGDVPQLERPWLRRSGVREDLLVAGSWYRDPRGRRTSRPPASRPAGRAGLGRAPGELDGSAEPPRPRLPAPLAPRMTRGRGRRHSHKGASPC